MYYYLYKITNTINNKIYIGVHRSTRKNDPYYGSGTNIKKAIKKYGKRNFIKEIIEYFLNEEEMLKREKEIVNSEFIRNENNYNIIIGGGHLNIDCHCYRNTETNELILENVNHKDVSSGKLISVNKDTITVKDTKGKVFRVPKDHPDFISGDLVGVAKDTIMVKDIKGKVFRVPKDHPDFISGDLVGVTKGNKLSDSHKEKLRLVNKGTIRSQETKKKLSDNAKLRYQYEDNPNQNKKWMFNIKQQMCKMFKPHEVEEYIKSGWELGRKFF